MGQSGRALGQILGKYRVSGGPPQFCHPPYLWHGLTDQAHILGNQNTRSQVLFGVLSPRIHMQIPPKVLEKLGSAQGKKIRCPLLTRLGAPAPPLGATPIFETKIVNLKQRYYKVMSYTRSANGRCKRCIWMYMIAIRSRDKYSLRGVCDQSDFSVSA